MFHHHLREKGQVLIADFVKTDTNYHGFELAELENKLAQFVFRALTVRFFMVLKVFS